jgi:hypothetical protein
MLFDYIDEINKFFVVEDGFPIRLVDKITWHGEIDKDSITDTLFQTTVKHGEGFSTLHPISVLCGPYLSKSVRRRIASHIDWALGFENQNSLEFLVMDIGPALLRLGPNDDAFLTAEYQYVLEKLQETKDIWPWLVRAFERNTDFPVEDEPNREDCNEAIMDLYLRLKL